MSTKTILDVTITTSRLQSDDFRYTASPSRTGKTFVQMGLAMDSDGVPITFELFPGNKLDKENFRSVIGEVRRNYNTGRIIVVADMGIITGDNIYYLTGGKKDKPLNGYVFSFSIRGGTDTFKAYVLNEAGYRDKNGKPVSEKRISRSRAG